MMEAEEAIRRFLRGDEEAFTGLVRQWETRVYNLAWRLLGNREDAQDAAQETFVSVYRALKDLRDPASFPSWLYRIALNHCRAQWRSRGHDMPVEIPACDAPDSERGAHNPVAPGIDASTLVEAKDLIRKSLFGLSEEHRTAVVLKEYVGLSLEELAQVMECPLSTAKSRLYHGLRGVQRNLRRLGVAPALDN
jgi:RNA polymerase sigma-70 factor (ECF subfamily)